MVAKQKSSRLQKKSFFFTYGGKTVVVVGDERLEPAPKLVLFLDRNVIYENILY